MGISSLAVPRALHIQYEDPQEAVRFAASANGIQSCLLSCSDAIATCACQASSFIVHAAASASQPGCLSCALDAHLAGLRMRLFYLHEQQQTRNQNVLAQLQTRQQLLPSLIPGMAGLALGNPALSPRHPASMANTPVGANTSQQQLFSDGIGSGEVASAGEASTGQNAEQQGQGEGAASGGEGPVSGGHAEGRTGEGDVLVGSGRSSLEKDQGPVVSVYCFNTLDTVSGMMHCLVVWSKHCTGENTRQLAC